MFFPGRTGYMFVKDPCMVYLSTFGCCLTVNAGQICQYIHGPSVFVGLQGGDRFIYNPVKKNNLGKFQQTPGTYPRPKKPPVYDLELLIKFLYFGVRFAYVPGVWTGIFLENNLYKVYTLPETTMASENRPPWKFGDSYMGNHHFFRGKLLVSGIISPWILGFTKVLPFWWTKSCTTKDDDYPIIYMVLYIPGGAGFLPSTVPSINQSLWLLFLKASRCGTCGGIASLPWKGGVFRGGVEKNTCLGYFSDGGPDSPYVWYNRYTYIDQYLPLNCLVMMVKYTVHWVFGFGTMFFVSNIIILLVGKVSRSVATRVWGYLFVRKFGHQFMSPDFCQPRVCFQFYMMMIFSTTKISNNAFVMNITQFLVGTYMYIVYPEWMDQVPKVKSMNLFGRGPQKKAPKFSGQRPWNVKSAHIRKNKGDVWWMSMA